MTDAERAQIAENKRLTAHLLLQMESDETQAERQAKLYPERPLAKVLPFRPRST